MTQYAVTEPLLPVEAQAIAGWVCDLTRLWEPSLISTVQAEHNRRSKNIRSYANSLNKVSMSMVWKNMRTVLLGRQCC